MLGVLFCGETLFVLSHLDVKEFVDFGNDSYDEPMIFKDIQDFFDLDESNYFLAFSNESHVEIFKELSKKFNTTGIDANNSCFW